MRKFISLSIVATSLLVANSTDLGEVEIKDSVVKTTVENVYLEEVKSADVAEALASDSASVELIRRSGVANDILLRGQKKDNIVVTIDDAKIYGACPNRMDPPTSHIVTNNIESIEITGGPFDVENMGTLSGQVNVKTKDPKEGLHGDMNLNMGSFGYQKFSASVGGGDKDVKVLVSASSESGDQYEDGDGNTLAQQLENKVGSSSDPMYNTTSEDIDAFDKKTLSTKLLVNASDNLDFKLSLMKNRSDNILYPSSTMDAIYDNSNLYNLEANYKNAGELSRELALETYASDVQHLMSTEYRNKRAMGQAVDAYVETEATGVKLKNEFDLGIHAITVGVDTSKRNWDGIKGIRTNPESIDDSFIPNVDTKNQALFANMKADLGIFDVEVGARYDKTNVKANEQANTMTSDAKKDIDYNSFSANIQGNYKLNDNNKIYLGLGQSYRVPDAKELFMSGGNAVASGDLEQTKNVEIDLGYEFSNESYGLKAKVFHSSLKNYIYYHVKGEVASTTNTNLTDGKTDSKYENIDAKIYGFELSGYKMFSETLTFDYGMSYQKGKKDSALDGQTDTDLADITPLKGNIAIAYDDNKHSAKLELVARDAWDNYDADNGEQKLAGYGVVNTKYNYKVDKNVDITFGMDNIFNKTYAMTNTYKDLTLAGTADGVMLINEPGRYTYTNFRVKF